METPGVSVFQIKIFQKSSSKRVVLCQRVSADYSLHPFKGGSTEVGFITVYFTHLKDIWIKLPKSYWNSVEGEKHFTIITAFWRWQVSWTRAKLVGSNSYWNWEGHSLISSRGEWMLAQLVTQPYSCLSPKAKSYFKTLFYCNFYTSI